MSVRPGRNKNTAVCTDIFTDKIIVYKQDPKTKSFKKMYLVSKELFDSVSKNVNPQTNNKCNNSVTINGLTQPVPNESTGSVTHLVPSSAPVSSPPNQEISINNNNEGSPSLTKGDFDFDIHKLKNMFKNPKKSVSPHVCPQFSDNQSPSPPPLPPPPSVPSPQPPTPAAVNTETQTVSTNNIGIQAEPESNDGITQTDSSPSSSLNASTQTRIRKTKPYRKRLSNPIIKPPQNKAEHVVPTKDEVISKPPKIEENKEVKKNPSPDIPPSNTSSKMETNDIKFSPSSPNLQQSNKITNTKFKQYKTESKPPKKRGGIVVKPAHKLYKRKYGVKIRNDIDLIKDEFLKKTPNKPVKTVKGVAPLESFPTHTTPKLRKFNNGRRVPYSSKGVKVTRPPPSPFTNWYYPKI